MTCIEITARRDGFRRCGMAHSSKPTVHDIDAFSAEELEILRNEPQLIVREVDGEEKSKETISKPTVKVKPSDVPPMAIKPENTEELLAAIVEAFDGLDKERISPRRERRVWIRLRPSSDTMCPVKKLLPPSNSIPRVVTNGLRHHSGHYRPVR